MVLLHKMLPHCKRGDPEDGHTDTHTHTVMTYFGTLAQHFQIHTNKLLICYALQPLNQQKKRDSEGEKALHRIKKNNEERNMKTDSKTDRSAAEERHKHREIHSNEMAGMVNNRHTKTIRDHGSFLRQKVNEGRSMSSTQEPVHAFTVPPFGRLENNNHREAKL